MSLEGFGSELSIGATILVLAKIFRDVYVEWHQKKSASKVANGHQGANPGPPPNPGGSSTNIVLHVLKDHGEKLRELGQDMTDVKVNLAKVNTKLEIK